MRSTASSSAIKIRAWDIGLASKNRKTDKTVRRRPPSWTYPCCHQVFNWFRLSVNRTETSTLRRRKQSRCSQSQASRDFRSLQSKGLQTSPFAAYESDSHH